jgi:ankyrin repeat protein
MFDVIKALLLLYPEAAGVQTQGGWTPLHYAVDRDAIDLDVVKILCITYPKGLSIQDREDKLPLHWAIDRELVDINVIRFLVKLYPLALFVKCYKNDIVNFIGFNAEEIAMERGHREVVRYMMMFNTPYRKVRNRELFGSLNWSSRCHLLLAVHVRYCDVKNSKFTSTHKSSEEAIFLR